ncbi:neuroligin-4, X-linked-like [Armigeres subalbatus]|uniref:neuroligin-4, X-linked-like n=1 Tax=Armigeres subalbatus TaxID=124917 RepID=UPI002ED1491A
MIPSVKCLIRLLIALIKRVFEDLFVLYWPGVQRPVVQVRQGRVQGVTAKLPNGKPYSYFKGIPYAKPPIGELRFRPPVPLERFDTPVLKCLIDRHDFIQPHVLSKSFVTGSEDALHLNVFTPAQNVSNEKKIPVMIYIHGGGLQNGTASSFVYDPQYLVMQGVIVITMSYRLGPFGFLCLPSAGVHGNFGLKDQRQALIWVQENIERFGGDPGNVTLFGESAGSWSTYLHYLSPSSRKYFHRAICQSGDTCTDSALQIDPEIKARKLAYLLGYRGSSDQEVIDILRKAPAKLLTKYQLLCDSEQERAFPLRYPFRPVIEQHESEDAILNQTPEKILKSRDSIRIPMINGYASNEGILALKSNKHRLRQFHQNPKWLVPELMGHPVGLNRTVVGDQIKQFYLGNKPIGLDTLNEVTDLFSDHTFVTTSNLSAEWLAKYQPNAKQYHYVFSFIGRFNFPKELYNASHLQGASHGDDCFHLFNAAFLPRVSVDSEEHKVRSFVVQLWANFAKYGDPTPDGGSLPVKWKPVMKMDPSSKTFDLDCLDITSEPRMIRNPFQERKEFWRAMIMKYTNYLYSFGSTIMIPPPSKSFLARMLVARFKRVFENWFVLYWPGIKRPVVQIRQGTVQGVTAKLPNGKSYCYFKGIPYAKPPTGELRFRPPVPLERFDTPVLKCFVDKNDFIQPLSKTYVMGSEDALYLNVYAPADLNREKKKTPVMVFIHGGGLENGSGGSFSYDPQYLVMQDVIVVIMNYRLGPFGFLCLPGAGVHGNFGLKDQRQALIWVQENIDYFGGDPDNVTLFGQSAGAWSTYLHYLSPSSRKYFHRAICLSGDACTESALQIDPESKARKLAYLLGYRGNSDQEVIDILRKAPAKLLAQYGLSCQSERETTFALTFPYRPVVEPTDSEDAIISQTPEKILKAFDTIRIPMISGYTNNEGILAVAANQNRLEQFQQNPGWLVPELMGHPAGLDREDVGKQIKKFFFGDKSIGLETVDELSDLFSDHTFVTTLNLSAEWLAKHQPNAKQYHYMFSSVGRLNIVKAMYNSNHLHGASHGDDGFYLFNSAFLPRLSKNSEEAKVREILTKLWTNFAKYGDPTPTNGSLTVKWDPVKKIDPSSKTFDLDCLEITSEPKMIRNPSQERKEFWRGLIQKYTNYL